MQRRALLTVFILISTTCLLVACAGKKAPTVDTQAKGGTTAEGSSAPGAGGGSETTLPTGSSATGTSLWAFPVIHFGFNEYTLPEADRKLLKDAAEQLKAQGGTALTIEGHCDERGSSEYNLALGDRRAQAVKGYLQRLGVESKQLNAISYGKERPADPGHDEAAWAKNRRAEILVNR